MNKISTRLISLSGAGILVALFCISEFASALEAGDKAPDFNLQASDGNTYTLAQFQGKQPVVIAFFPKAFGGG